MYDSQDNIVPHCTIQVLLVPADGTNVANIDTDANGVVKVTMTVIKAPQTYLVYVLASPSTSYHETAETDETAALVMGDTSNFQQNIGGSPFIMPVQAGAIDISFKS